METPKTKRECQRWSAARRDARPCGSTNAQRRRPGKQPTSDETKAAVLEMMSRGVNTREIARTLHVGSHAIADVRRANGFKQRAQRQTPAPLFYKEKVRKPAPHPVPNTIAAMQREQDRLLELMTDAPTTAMYQELARQYSVLQMKIDYATAMGNDANRELVRSRAAMEKRPLCQIVANGNGFSHH